MKHVYTAKLRGHVIKVSDGYNSSSWSDIYITEPKRTGLVEPLYVHPLDNGDALMTKLE